MVVLVQPRLVPGLPPRELRVEEVAVLGDHAAGLDALALAHAPILPRGRPGLLLPQVGPEPVADAGILAESFLVLPRPQAVPPAPRILADVVERAGRRVAPQVVAGVGLSPKVAGGRAGVLAVVVHAAKILQEDVAPLRTAAVEAVGHRRDALRVVGTPVRAAGADAVDIIHARQRVVVGAVPGLRPKAAN